ncbi:MAG: hypothetical protein ACUVQG_10915 [Thermogutta sp.]
MLRKVAQLAQAPGNLRVAAADPGNEGQSMRRFFLWIDGVGGYLVCRGETVRIGRPGNAGVDVPLLADIADRHAEIRRDAEGYFLESFAPAWLDGRPVRQIPMPDRCRLHLGRHVVLQFVRSTPVSLSARLDFESGHRTHPTTDGILLMAQNLILGPGRMVHVRCSHWRNNVVLFRQGDELWCRTGEVFRVDGVPQMRVAKLTLSSWVEGVDFALRLEEMPL